MFAPTDGGKMSMIENGPTATSYKEVLAVRALRITYRRDGVTTEAVGGLDLSIHRGEVVALVGESGSGKSTIARAIMGMLPASAEVQGGSILLEGRDILSLSEAEMACLRGRRLGWVPQDPMVALNPLHRIGRQVTLPLRLHRIVPKRQLPAQAIALLDRVGLSRPELRVRQLPHELSGGMRQRVLIAGAIGPGPGLIIADEPTTALDVTVQKQILDDLSRLTRSSGTAMLLITHDLAVAIERADRIVVLRHGRVVEEGPARTIVQAPRAPYTRALLASAPSLSRGRQRVDFAANLGRAPQQLAPLLRVEGLVKDYPHGNGRGQPFRAVDAVSLTIAPGETLGLVGESGSGKSTLARMILALTAPTAGSIQFGDVDLALMNRQERRLFRRQAQVIYQNPYASLSPRMTAVEIVAEPFRGYRLGARSEWRRRALALLDRVGLTKTLADRYPAELSGGQQQRVAIARALAPGPKLIVCDEPVSALDVSIQAQILALLSEMQEALGLSYLFISHDLAVVRQVADRVAVMKDGILVEIGAADDLFAAPRHSYTRLLLDSIPGQTSRRAA
jgi:peptide/nickel transport system ATP-binding protein